MLKNFSVVAKRRFDMVNITAHVQQIIRESSLVDRLCVIFCPHPRQDLRLVEMRILMFALICPNILSAICLPVGGVMVRATAILMYCQF